MSDSKGFSGSRCAEERAWANRQLRYGIRVLQGDPSCGGIKGSWDQSASGSPFHSAIGIAVNIKQCLEFEGFHWQAERLENWINKARANGDFLRGRYALRPSKKADPIAIEGGPPLESPLFGI
ncbi:hypothetical protein MUP77_09545 [Candidatus Bathyarchaeota archaeon]|nr:hypothetical protein [Candidatus Bathyarchaeota archaeon]